MKFAHLADCHIGSWREPKLSNISTDAFNKAIDISIEKQVDFVVIAGDLFNTPLPSIDKLKAVVKRLKQLKEKNIPVYGIPGSHDFSPSGKTMIDVLESAGLFENVCRGEVTEDQKLKLKFTTDQKTETKLTGIIGKRGMLDKKIYEALDYSIENEPGNKIFLFHTLLTELKPKELEKMDSQDISLLPKNFNYYAGGHPHFVKTENIQDYKNICYPGPLFPNSFSELEKLHHGGFLIVNNFMPEFIPIELFKTHHIKLKTDHKTPTQIENDILTEIENTELTNKIVTIRIEGILETGKRSDIDFKSIFEKIYQKDAYLILKNTNQLHSKEFEEIKVDASSPDQIENDLIKEHVGQIKIPNITEDQEVDLTKDLINTLSSQRSDGEKVADFEKRIIENLNKIIR